MPLSSAAAADTTLTESDRVERATSAAAPVTAAPASAAAPAVESLRERFLREMEAETAASRQRVRDAWEAARRPSPEPVKGVDSAPAAAQRGRRYRFYRQ